MFTHLSIKKVLPVCVLTLITLSISAKELTISAAASLNNAFKEIAQDYETKHPDTKILLNFAASGTLLQQIAKGAPVDIFASADQETMNQAVAQKLINVESRQNFINNTLVLIVPINSKAKLQQLTDLNEQSITRIAVGNPAYVPAGRYTEQALEQTKQWSNLQDKFINTQNVRQTLDYVARGEVDAGFVYSSDAHIMANKVKVVLTVPTETVITYPIAQVASSKQAELAKDFIAYILSDKGQTILVKYGFEKRTTIDKL